MNAGRIRSENRVQKNAYKRGASWFAALSWVRKVAPRSWWQEWSGNEMAAKAEGAFRGATRPNRLQIDADWRKDGDMENCKDVLW
jgi:hypothetical protein